MITSLAAPAGKSSDDGVMTRLDSDRRVMAWLRRQWNGLLDLIFPRWCAGCGAWDEDLCAECQAEFAVRWFTVEERLPFLSHVSIDEKADTSPFPVYALANYEGPAAKAIVRWKNVTDRRLDQTFDALLRARDPVVLPARARPVLVVPAPSSTRRTRDGRFVAGVIAFALAAGHGGTVANVLRQTRPRRRQALQARGRKARTVGISAVNLRHWDVILVDDVVTTGATLAGAARAVTSHGGRVVGAFALAATNDPRQLRAAGHMAKKITV